MATERVNISIKADVLNSLDRLADDAGMDRSSFIELMVMSMSHLEKNDFKKMSEYVFGMLVKSMRGSKK